MNHGYEVTWPSSYSPSPDCLDAGELDADAVGYSARDFEFKFQALAVVACIYTFMGLDRRPK